jgi:flagellar M-ring protein FliF
MVRQLGVIIAIAVAVAVGGVVALWSSTPNYSLLYGSLAQNDASEVVAALQQSGIEYKVDETTGAVMIPTKDLHEARLKLAGQGLPRGDGLGFELLQQDTGFGTSRLVEAARHQRALEGELARTIATLGGVQSARVHLATPKQSVFVRKSKKTSASVAVKLFPGRILEKGQVASIVHLVASSVPELETENVTVVDHKGNLLSGQGDEKGMMLTTSQFEYTKNLEEHYRERIESILAPMLGEDAVRAQVTADIDFTITEQTQEQFNPESSVVRSEQVNEESSSLTAVQGIPGALSNQPPGGGVAPERVGQVLGDERNPTQPLSSTKQATRNFELDKTISHTRLSTGNLRRLSVAVVVDDPPQAGAKPAEGEERQQRSPEELERITQLVQEAIGFSTDRGDSVRVINAPFRAQPELEPLPEQPIWEKAWVWDLGRMAGGGALVLVLIFVVLLPTIKRLLTMPERVAVPMPMPQLEEEQQQAVKLPGRGGYENTLEAARGMVQEDPKRVAQVVRRWVAEDAG